MLLTEKITIIQHTNNVFSIKFTSTSTNTLFLLNKTTYISDLITKKPSFSIVTILFIAKSLIKLLIK